MPNHRMFRRAIMTAAGALTVAAVVQQLRRPRSERTWQGQIIGVPYDFRKPTIARLREQWWNPDGPLFTPHSFGVGWSVNGYRLVHRGRKPAAEVTDLEVKE
jgi:hypothetical protein